MNALKLVGSLPLIAAAASALAGCPNPTPLVSPPATGGTRGATGNAIHPNWGATVTQTDAPPPISGGTLLVASDGHTAIASDPDRDRIDVVDLNTRAVLAQLPLWPHDEPGRIVEDGARRVHVVLRGGGAVATVSLDSLQLLERRSVCATPRGIAYQASSDSVHVACASGELVTLPAAGGDATRRLDVQRDGENVRDLRDVVVSNDQLLLTTFRSAQLLTVDADGVVTSTTTPPTLVSTGPSAYGGSNTVTFTPTVAWRTIPVPGGSVAMVHQRALSTEVVQVPAYYTPQSEEYPCQGAVVHTAITLLEPGQRPNVAPTIPTAVLPVDIALSPDRRFFAIVAAGNALQGGAEPQVYVYSSDAFSGTTGQCAAEQPGQVQPQGQATALAYDAQGRLVVQTREPAALFVAGAGTIALPGGSRADTGHTMFHANAGGSLACASCHPEGGDDGHTWNFPEVGERRSQNLRGGLLATAPFHWEGDLPTMSDLMQSIFTGRMNGGQASADQATAVGHWLDQLPALPAFTRADPAAVERGRVLFTSSETACTTCHTGEHFTNNSTAWVGTEVPVQVPSLVGVAWRAPFIHTGCAATLRDRFNPSCGGGDQHGHTSQLSAAQVGDLVAYLESI